ncbi:hypothetical protein AKJ16_DCAP00261 [Drosera capensis]
MLPSLGPQAIAFATAIAAVSGTIIFLVRRLHKSSAPTLLQECEEVKVNLLPSSCISSLQSVMDATAPDEGGLKEEAASPTSLKPILLQINEDIAIRIELTCYSGAKGSKPTSATVMCSRLIHNAVRLILKTMEHVLFVQWNVEHALHHTMNVVKTT